MTGLLILYLNHASTLHHEDAGNACNRTAAVYLLRDEWCPRARSTKLLQGEEEISFIAAALFQYTYHRWFHPYKSEVDLGQFLTKVNIPSAATDLPVKTCSLAMVERLKRSHTNFCERVRDIIDNETFCEQVPGLFGGHKWRRHMRPFFYIQPVFEAVIVAVRTGEFDFATTDIADMRTLIVATGKEAKSGPIDLSLIDAANRLDSVFDNGRLVAVESRLEVTLSFLLDLEQREHALGMQPAPANLPVCDMDDSVARAMEDLGWDPAEPLHGPSSAWVDTDNHSTRTVSKSRKLRVLNNAVECWAYQCYRFRRRAEGERTRRLKYQEQETSEKA
ncbi:hypothetical protein BBO_09034 [Beauveria brongniartii RCEF 3172]|uniref:Uncharacterized protein n=1 Tax=Beauveria brongniartii RCEF 3172 TaxID=1081107 RepID=A0A166WK14_9HYPO|nr:hypothetical protein BBO_09034 [Beauveria brongniartii RCEF 3172]